jgi:gamma-glutamyl phosphate reductase
MEFDNDQFFNTWEEALNYIRQFEDSTHSRFIVTKKKKDGTQFNDTVDSWLGV